MLPHVSFGARWLVSFLSTSADTLLHTDLRLLPAVCPWRGQIKAVELRNILHNA